MKRLLAVAALVVAIPAFAHAQQPGATVLDSDSCASTTILVPGNSRPLVQTRQGQLCTSANFSGSVTIGTVTQGTPAAATFAAAWPTYTPGYSFFHISTATTTTVKSGAGVVHGVCINNDGSTSATATVYNNTAGSGAVIAVIGADAAHYCYTYDIAFSVGLTVVTVGSPNAADITVSYR